MSSLGKSCSWTCITSPCVRKMAMFGRRTSHMAYMLHSSSLSQSSMGRHPSVRPINMFSGSDLQHLQSILSTLHVRCSLSAYKKLQMHLYAYT